MRKSLYFLALLGLAVTVFMGKSYETTLQAMDSSTYARLALDATRHFPLRLPIGDQNLGEGYWRGGFNDHPPTLIWTVGWVMRALGPDAFSARLLPSFFGVLCILLLFVYGLRIFKSTSAGLCAAIFLLATPLFVSFAARFQLDPAHIFGILLSFFGFASSSLALCTLGVVVAVWVKGPLGFLVFPSVLIAKLILREKNRAEWKRFVLYSIVGVLAGGSIWAIIAWLGTPALPLDYWNRFVMGQVADRNESPNWIVSLNVAKRNFPTLLIALFALWRAKKDGLMKDERIVTPLVGTAIVFLLVFKMRAKYEHYYLPAFALLAVAVSGSLRRWLDPYEERIGAGIIALALLLPPILVAAPIPLNPERFPQLKAWMPFIQRLGKCREKILFVEGGNPYGSRVDYAALLQFYTNREVVGANDCAELAHQIDDPALENEITWVILSDHSYTRCWNERWNARFPAKMRYENQFLLSHYAALSESVDLSPLQSALQAVRDCEIPTKR